MSNEINFMVLSGPIDAHEYLQIDHQPNDPELVKDLQLFCVTLLSMAVLTRAGCTKDKLEMAMEVTVDGKVCNDSDIPALYKAIDSLNEAERFSIDLRYNGRIDFRYIWDDENDDGEDSRSVMLACPEAFEHGMYHYMTRYMQTELFVCKFTGYAHNHDIMCGMKIEDGHEVDVMADEPDDTLKTRCGDWSCAQMSFGVDFDLETYAAEADALRETVRRHLPEDELPYVEQMREERAEKKEQTVDLLCSSYWGDLPALDAYLAEVNEIIRTIPGVALWWMNEPVWYSMSDFAVAELVVEDNGFCIVTKAF